MLRMPENEFERRLLWRPVIPARTLKTSLETRLEQAVPIKEQLDAASISRERWRPDFRRAYSAGRLLFQVIGVAGYAGYFVSMHTLMRFFSGALMAGAWYAIYRMKGVARP